MTRSIPLFLLLAGGLLAASPEANAQANTADAPGTAGIADTPYRSPLPIRIERVEGPITLDGRVTEPAWDALTPLPWYVYDPSYGAPSTQNTEFRVGFDDDFLYFSCRCFDTEPDKV
ncbi:MAG: hypothetical protein RIE53_07105 [Rhodothermales bacterium]